MADRHAEELRTFAHLADLLAENLPREVFERRIRIVVGDDVLASEAGQVLVLTLARLAPRFCHRIDFTSPTAPCIKRLQPLLHAEAFSSASLVEVANLIWPDGTFSADGDEPVDVVVGVGTGGDLSVGIDTNGAATVVVDGAVAVERDDALFAALTAAGLACSQTAKLLYPEILKAEVEPIVQLEAGPFGGRLDRGELVTLARPFVAGVGAVGCALVYALIVVGARGAVVLLDPDVVNDSNLMRYILFDSRHLGMDKVKAAAELVAAAGLDLKVEPAKTVIQGYLKRHPAERECLELVVSAVDSYDARRDITGDLPCRVVNAGTTPRNFTVSRHEFADGYACLACLYPARPEDADQDAVMARALGLERAEIAELRKTKKGLTEAQVARIARFREQPDDAFTAYVGEPIDSFYNKEFCAKVAVETARGEAVAPLAHGSALAGFLLAHATAFDDEEVARRFRMDVVSGLATPQRTAPRSREACPYCGHSTYRRVYAQRWGDAKAA